MKQFRQFFTLILLPLDYLMVLGAFVLAYRLKLEFPVVELIYVQPFSEYLSYMANMALVWPIVFFGFGLYRFRRFHNSWELFGKVVLACTVALAIFIIGLFLTKTYFFSRLTIVYFWPLSILMVLAGRALLDFFKTWLQNYGLGVEQVVIIGSDKVASEFSKYYKQLWPSFKILGVLPRLDFDQLMQLESANRVVVSYEPEKSEMIQLIRWCEDHDITLQYVPSLIGLYASKVVVDSELDHPVLELAPTPLAGWGRIIKRLFDIFLSILGLVIALPIMLAVAIAIKTNSKGPIIFAQKRIGEFGKPFVFYKFRSMYTELSTGDGYGGKQAEELLAKLRAESNEADGLLFKMTHDPRVTSVGRFIRKTSLDELPQLFNVLKGEMSLVGPRPALPEEVANYDDTTKRRLLVKPGVTGMWQVSGRNDVTFDEYVRLDTYYIEHWSIWLDIKIILLTVRAVFARTGK